jgi:hypothetical protein
MNRKLIYLIPVISMFALAACNLNPPNTVSSSDIATFQRIFMSSYIAERGGHPGGAKALTPFLDASPGGAARATLNVALVTLTNNGFLTLAPSTFPNYPEPGQSTSFVVTLSDATNHVYDVTATTTYPATDSRQNYVEEYFVRDIGLNSAIPPYNDVNTPDGKWTVDDPIVKSSGGNWVQDQKARVKMILTFTDGTTRSETIVTQTDSYSSQTPPKFAAFDVAGSLDFGQLFIPAADANAVFSSVVIYNVTPSTNPNFWFWQGSENQTILGIRYYTEFQDTGAGKYYTNTILFEKTLSTLTTQGTGTSQVWPTVFVSSEFDALAESVLRQQVTYSLANGKIDYTTGTSVTNMQSRVVDITGMKDFYLQQLNSDYVSLSGWDTTTIYTPAGNAAEILAGDPNKFLYARTLTVTGSSAPLAILTTSIPTAGLGDLASLYTSLQNGAANVPVPSNQQPSNPISTSPYLSSSDTEQLQFSGSNKGTEVPYGSSYDLYPQGTIEAWVYIKQHTDTGGIVHKGVKVDFTDECYSLQFWGNQGQLALVLDGVNGTNYDLLTSTINLNTGRWYYIVATWDRGATPNYMKLYINGNLNRSRTPTVSGAPQRNDSEVLIGSQLPSQYSTAYGYFTLNGAIYGVKVYGGTPPTAAAISSFYNANQSLTSGWPHP